MGLACGKGERCVQHPGQGKGGARFADPLWKRGSRICAHVRHTAASLPLARCPCGAGASRPQHRRPVLAPSLFFLLPSRTDATASEKRNDCPLRARVRVVRCTSLRVRPSSCLTPPLLGARSACPTAFAWSILPSLHLARPVGGKVMLWQYPFFMWGLRVKVFTLIT